MGRKKILEHKVIQAFVLELEQLEWLREASGNLSQSMSAFLRDLIEEFRDRRDRGKALVWGKAYKPKRSLWDKILGR